MAYYEDDDEVENPELEEEKKSRKKKRFRLFDSQRDGKGVSKEEANIPPNFIGFFKRYKRDFSRLLTVNIFYVLGMFPILFILIAFGGAFQVPYSSPNLVIYPVLDGIQTLGGGIGLNGVMGTAIEGNAWSTGTYILLACGCLSFFTFGPVNVGTTYLLRNMLNGTPIFFWSDFWGAVKRNFKQGFVYGIFDLLILLLIPFNIVQLWPLMGNGQFFTGVLFWANLVIGLIYVFMRYYIYLQMVTFDLKIFKILKNSLIFAIIGFKRNILAFLGMLLFLFLEYVMVAGGGILLPLAFALPLVLLFSNCSYMSAYAAYFKIKEVMIDPYYKEHPELNPEAQAEDTPKNEEDESLS